MPHAAKRCQRPLPGAFHAPALIAALLCLWAAVFPAAAAGDAALKQRIEAFLASQTRDTAGEVRIEVSMPDAKMAACRSPEPFLPGGNARLAGNVTVGVRCPGDRPALRYYRARVSVASSYYVAAHALQAGDVISAADLREEYGDLSRLHRNVATVDAAVVGMALTRRLAAGMPLTTGMLERPKAIERGDQVTVVAGGSGFSITTEGKALNAAALGEQVRVNTRDGATVTGISGQDKTVTVGR